MDRDKDKDNLSDEIREWVESVRGMCLPNSVWVCDGSDEEYFAFCDQLVREGRMSVISKLDRCYLCLSDPGDVARSEDRTFICCDREDDAGLTNNWREPGAMKDHLVELFRGCMAGRTMYVIPFCMGFSGSEFAVYGVQITDSLYVALSMRVMTRVGSFGDRAFVRCLHSVGRPLVGGAVDVVWPFNPEKKVIAHFPSPGPGPGPGPGPDDDVGKAEIWSFGSGYGGNALLGKKCLALRIASVLGKHGGWLAEHMLILKLTGPCGRSIFVLGSFPSSCGKTNLAMLKSPLVGWKVECVGDDIAWLRVGRDDRLYAVNPEAGFFGVVSGTGPETNPVAFDMIRRNTIFTNVGRCPDGDVWWEGKSERVPDGVVDWMGMRMEIEMVHNGRSKVAHPNSRFTTPLSECSSLAAEWNRVEGVPISAILFGGRRSDGTVPLCVESYGWNQGVLMGASLSSETTAAATGTVGVVRNDPFAMLPFCGYNMADYLAHWVEIGALVDRGSVRFYQVNWFQKDDRGQYMWPGFGENIHVLKWIFERAHGGGSFIETPIGIMPLFTDFSLLPVSRDVMDRLLTVDNRKWDAEVRRLREYFGRFGSRFPKELIIELDNIVNRLGCK